jgi:hypothetical protein
MYIFLKPYVSKKYTDNSQDLINDSTIILLSILFVTALLIGVYAYSNISLENILLISYVFAFLIGLMVIVALAMVFIIFMNSFKTMSGWKGFIARLVFYIPCLLVDLIQYIKQQYGITSNTVYILFIMEIMLILCYIYIPKIIHKITSNNGISLLKDSRFLDKQYVISNSEILQLVSKNKNNKNVDDKEIEYRQNFAISMWIYINPQPTNYNSYSKESIIFTMGNDKPKITYINKQDDIHKKDKIAFYFNDNKPYYISNNGQKWMNIVLNCTSTTIDLFIDGNLERTFNLENPPFYKATDDFIIGDNDGLDGAISNVTYYNEPLTRQKITNAYNILQFKNPPINDN